MLTLPGTATPPLVADGGRAGTLDATGPGGLLFARFAFPPNSLGLCGPETGLTLPERVRDGRMDRELRHIAQGFEGAWPYLELIAAENDLRDPLDARVVEAYWLGNDLLGHVGARAHQADLENRFRARAGTSEWRWLEAKADSEARVHHSFHVLEVLPRIGLIRGGLPPDLLAVLERCLIRPGVVRALADGHLEVEVPPLGFDAGKLRFGTPRIERLAFGPGDAYGDDITIGDRVALHWERVCGRLTPVQAARLRAVTERNIAVANTTI